MFRIKQQRMSETISKTEASKEFNRKIQSIQRDVERGFLNADENGRVIKDELYDIRKKQCKLKDKQARLMAK